MPIKESHFKKFAENQQEYDQNSSNSDEKFAKLMNLEESKEKLFKTKQIELKFKDY